MTAAAVPARGLTGPLGGSGARAQRDAFLADPRRVPGWAAACVTVARLANPMRPALAIVNGASDDITNAVVETARRFGIVIGMEAWDSSGERLGSEAHLERLDGLVGASTGGSVALATDEKQIEDMVAAAGPIVAWNRTG